MAPIKDLTGKRFGRLLVKELLPNRITYGKAKKLAWRCVCDCGAMVIVNGDHLKNGYTRSCGCLSLESSKANIVRAAAVPHLKHGLTVGGKRTPEYRSWSAMLSRCSNSELREYKNYGGRGIMVCNSWFTFQNFLDDMGPRPEGTSLDRINNEGNYEPGNCRWATPHQQANNKRKESWSKNTSEAIKKHWKVRRERGDIGRQRA